MKRALLFLLVLLFADPAFAQEFSATIVSPDSNQGSGKLYVAGTHVRADLTDTSDGQPDVQVMLLDLGATPKLVRLDPAEKTFSAIDVPNESATAGEVIALLSGHSKQLCDVPGLKSCRFVGIRSVDSRTCDRYKASDADDNEYEVCFDQQLHFPLAFRKIGEDAIELKDVKIENQPDWLFAVPKGFKEVPFGCRLPAPPPPPQ